MSYTRGTGIRKIITAAETYGVPKPTFEEIGSDFLTTFFGLREKIIERLEKKEHPEYIKKTDLSHLNKRQIDALRLMINEKKRLTNKEYRELFNVSKITAVRDLSKLAKEGLIVESGKGRSLCYHYK